MGAIARAGQSYQLARTVASRYSPLLLATSRHFPQWTRRGVRA